MIRKLTTWLLLAIIFINVFATVYSNRILLVTKYDPQYWQSRYQESNWEKGWEGSSVMGDGELYAYAGWRQIQGDDPSKINTEMPPLGKYLIGLSILLFNNPYWVSLVMGLLLIIITYQISKLILKDCLWALIPPCLLSFDGLFKDNLLTTMLDLPFAVFISLSFYLLFKARKNNRYYPLLLLSLGVVSATKMYLVGFALTGVIFLFLLLLFLVFRYKDVFWFLLSTPMFILIYFGSYIVYFLNNHNLWDFKYLHFWVRHFARVQVDNYPQFEIIRILMLGQWKTWWGGSGVVNVESWNVLWPISTITSLITGIAAVFKKNLDLLILPLWIFSLIGMYTYGVPYPRYLLPVLPALYLSLVILVEKILNFRYVKK